jgi:hypothetical protein
MRRWRFLDRLFHTPDPRAWDRCVLVVEELEVRENPAPVVFAPFDTQTDENVTVALQDPSGSESSTFFAFDPQDAGQAYSATFTATNGTVAVNETAAQGQGLTVANNGTATVTVTGSLNALQTFLQTTQISYTPTAFYSGAANVNLTVADLTSGANDSDAVSVFVRPVASPAFLSVNTSGEALALTSSGFAFASGVVSIESWPDADGSESATITFSLDAPDPSLFALFAGGVEIEPLEPGLWEVSASNAAALQALFDSLVLVPPSDFTGRVSLAVFGSLIDTASDPFGSPAFDSADLGFDVLDLRFFQGNDVSLTPVSGAEGATLDLGNRFVASDQDLLPGDTSALTLSVPSGLFTFSDAALVEGMSADRSVADDGGTTITLTGNLDAINAFLATPGSLLYSAADPGFSGVVPLTVTLANLPGPPPPPEESEGGSGSFLMAALGSETASEAPGKFSGVAALRFAPVADHAFPLAEDAVTGQDTPVAVSINVAPLPADASESVLIVVDGVPDGGSFNHGASLGNGTWALALSDLAGLMFNPPPGASGVYAFGVRAIVTDTANDGTTDTATESTTFAITVNPAPVPLTPAPVPLFLLTEEEEFAGDFDDSTGTVDFGDTVSADSDVEDQPDAEEQTDQPILAEAIAGNNAAGQGSTTTDERGLSAPGQGSLFSQPELPAPSYAGGEKHPLPPVLPLDQSSSVAGFTESGGDSFALIDKLYRDGAVAQGSEPPASEVAAGAPAAEGAAVPPAAEQTVAVVDAASNPDGGFPGLAELSESDARVWIAGGTVVGALIAWSRLKRSPDGRLARAARWLLHPNHEPVPTEA